MLYGWHLLSDKEVDLIRQGVREGRALGGPYHLLLHPTDVCNLDCFFCYTEDLRRTAAKIPWGRLRAVLDEGIEMGVKAVSLSGGGEPLMYRAIRPLLARIEEAGLLIDSINTNATPVTQEMAATLMRCGLRQVRISLNETTPETYAEMNRCSPRLFDKAMRGTDNLIAAKRKANADTEISVQVFIWRENRHRFLDMIESVLSTGADLVYINSIDCLAGERRMSSEQCRVMQSQIDEAIERWGAQLRFNLLHEGLQDYTMARVQKITPEVTHLPDLTGAPERIEYCYIGWQSVTIGADGGVYPCCHFASDPSRSLGFLSQESLREIWYGKRAEQYRQEMRHLQLTKADPSLLPRRPCFIHSLCMKRSECAFNFYLADPDTYWDLERWAESGPRDEATSAQRRRAAVVNALRRAKRLVKNALPGQGGA